MAQQLTAALSENRQLKADLERAQRQISELSALNMDLLKTRLYSHEQMALHENESKPSEPLAQETPLPSLAAR